MSSFRNLWGNNSIFSKVAAMSMASIFLSSIFLATYLIYTNIKESEQIRKQVIIEQVKQTLSLTEDQQLASKYKIVANALNNIQSIEEVVLYDKKCQKLFSIPMNAIHSSLCTTKQGQDSKLIYEIKNSYSHLRYITIKAFTPSYSPLIVDIIGLIIFVIIFSVATTLLMLTYLRKYFEGPFNQIIEFILNISPTAHIEKDFTKELPQELIPLKETLLQTKKDLHTSQEKVIEQEKKQAMAEICLQIAHDIRSPLPVIEKFAASDLNNSTKEDKELLKKASKRISDIAKQLLKRKNDLLGFEDIQEEKEPTDITFFIKDIIKEKSVSLNSNNIEIVFNNQVDSNIMYNLPAISFSRSLSSLIQNAIEAVSSNGRVEVTLYQSNLNVLISIKDNGKGIKPEDLDKIKNKGISVGKINGTGLGLTYATEVIESLNGEITVTSELGKGTTVTLSLPKAKKIFDKNSHYVLIDNDEITHFNWKQSAKKDDINLTTFFSPNDFFQDLKSFSPDTIICIDSNLGNGIKGEIESQEIYIRGFKNIFLVTGQDKQSLEKCFWINGIKDKKPLWTVSK
jgi:signal transduction histidine kinase